MSEGDERRRYDEVAARFHDAEGIEARQRIADREQRAEVQQRFEFALADALHGRECGCGSFDPASDPTWVEKVASLMPVITEHVEQALADEREAIARAIDHHRENNAGSFDRQYGLILAARMVRDFGREPT